MTNFEKYKDEILAIANSNDDMAIQSGNLVYCGEITCAECDFYRNDCIKRRFEWLYEEYKEPEIDWNSIAVDTPIIVSSDGIRWFREYFAKFENNKVYAWGRGGTSWSIKNERAESRIYYWKYAKLADVEEKNGQI